MPMIWIYLMFFYISETTKNIDVYLFLFDDMILITKTKRGRKVSNWCPLTSEQMSLMKPLDTFRHWWFVWNSWNTMEHSQPPEIRIFFINGIKVLIFLWMTTFQKPSDLGQLDCRCFYVVYRQPIELHHLKVHDVDTYDTSGMISNYMTLINA